MRDNGGRKKSFSCDSFKNQLTPVVEEEGFDYWKSLAEVQKKARTFWKWMYL